ncbi:MAG: hypothetical protein KGJ13_07520 [Patescibacteria group bacterium]|nr:hypothetical protein [Patescibacteria group bacterium]
MFPQQLLGSPSCDAYSARQGLDLPDIFDIGPKSKANIRRAVKECVRYWPNADFDSTNQENIAAAFRFIRRCVKSGMSLSEAANHVARDALRYENM